MAGFPSPQPQQGFAQLPTEAGKKGIVSPLHFYGAVHLWNPCPRTAVQCFLQSTACLCLSAALLLFLRRSWHSLVIITIAKAHFTKLGSTFSTIRGRTWEQERRCWAAMPALLSLVHCDSVLAVWHIVFHRMHAFTSWSPLKFRLAGAEILPYMVSAQE